MAKAGKMPRMTAQKPAPVKVSKPYYMGHGSLTAAPFYDEEGEIHDQIAIVLHMSEESVDKLTTPLLMKGPLHVRVAAKLIEDES